MTGEMIKLKPIKFIKVGGLFPYDFYNIYQQIFRTDKFFPIPSSIDEVKRDLSTLCYGEDVFYSSAQLVGEEFVHTTGSGRILKYDFVNLTLEVAIGGEGSTTFAYAIVAALAPLMQPEKWRGIGGGNVGWDGKVWPPFSITVS